MTISRDSVFTYTLVLSTNLAIFKLHMRPRFQSEGKLEAGELHPKANTLWALLVNLKGTFYILAQEFCPNVWDRIYKGKREKPHFQLTCLCLSSPFFRLRVVREKGETRQVPVASRLSRVGWFSRALAFPSLYYPWEKMGTLAFRSLYYHNLRSGSIFVSHWKLHSGGQGETKMLAVAVRENVWEPLKLGLISGYYYPWGKRGTYS